MAGPLDAAAPPVDEPAVLPFPPCERTLTGALALTGALTAVAGLTLAEPIWIVPTDRLADWSEPVEPLPFVFEAEAPPFDELVEPPAPLEATLTGVLALIGALTAVAGATVAEPTCTVPMELRADWPDVPLVPLALLLDAAAPLFDVLVEAVPPREATLTGVLALMGALTAVAGATVAEPTCTVPMERRAVWPVVPLVPLVVLEAAAPGLAVLVEELAPREATLTGALALMGVLTAVAGEAVKPPTCTVPTEPSAD